MKHISIVYSSDNNYVPYLGVSIQSVIENANQKNMYDIYVLTQGLTEISTQTLMSMQQANVSIKIIDIKPYMMTLDTEKMHVSGHITIASYFRLFIPEIFSDLDKIIYADCDVFFMRDIADLFKINLSDKYIAAVKDIGLIASGAARRDTEYYCGKLGLDNPDDYFNSGLILYNLVKMRENNIIQCVLNAITEMPQPRYHDQCILNYICRGHVLFIPFNWNYWGNYKFDCPDYKDYFPSEYLGQFADASANPYAIHYKPWLNPYVEHAMYFWRYARNSPFYEIILYKNIYDYNTKIQTRLAAESAARVEPTKGKNIKHWYSEISRFLKH